MLSPSDQFALALQLASCFTMTGVILVIQLIHYPCFSQISRSSFTAFHAQHSSVLSLTAGPVMTVELFSALWLAQNGNPWLILNVLAVTLTWLITFFISVPSHNQLSQGFNQNAWEKLVQTNWLRTGLWSLRSLAFLVWLSVLLRTN